MALSRGRALLGVLEAAEPGQRPRSHARIKRAGGLESWGGPSVDCSCAAAQPDDMRRLVGSHVEALLASESQCPRGQQRIAELEKFSKALKSLDVLKAIEATREKQARQGTAHLVIMEFPETDTCEGVCNTGEGFPRCRGSTAGLPFWRGRPW